MKNILVICKTDKEARDACDRDINECLRQFPNSKRYYSNAPEERYIIVGDISRRYVSLPVDLGGWHIDYIQYDECSDTQVLGTAPYEFTMPAINLPAEPHLYLFVYDSYSKAFEAWQNSKDKLISNRLAIVAKQSLLHVEVRGIPGEIYKFMSPGPDFLEEIKSLEFTSLYIDSDSKFSEEVLRTLWSRRCKGGER